MANGFVHIELNTTDPKAAKSFYGRLFNWQLEDMDMGGGATYTMIKPGEGPGGGMMQHPMPGAPSMWLTYINVDDLKASTERRGHSGLKCSGMPPRCRTWVRSVS